MPNWLKISLGTIVGIFVGGASIAIIEMVGHQFIKGDGVFVVAVFGLAIAAFIGGSLANWVGKVSYPTWIIAIVLAGLSLMNVMTFKHPVWFVPAALVLLGAGAWLAYSLTKNRSLQS